MRSRVCQRLVDVWIATQVELHGQYSLDRLARLDAYTQRTPLWRVVLVCLATPALAVLLITLTDAMPLRDPMRGLDDSQILWLRAFVSVCAIAGGSLVQLRIIVPKLDMAYAEVVTLTLLSSAAGVATQYAIAIFVGFPVPFSLVMGTPWCFAVLVVGVTVPRRALLRATPTLRRQLENYVSVWICQIAMTIMYPVYNHFFVQLASTAQTAFVLVLPVMKLLNKNWISHLLRETDDMRPEIVVFNMEIFHALYVSVCMQSSTSVATTAALVAVDVAHASLSICDIHVLLRELEQLMDKLPSGAASQISTTDTQDQPSSAIPSVSRARKHTIIEAATAVVREDERVRTHERLCQSCFVSSIRRRTSSAVGVGPLVPGPRISSQPLSPVRESGPRASTNGIYREKIKPPTPSSTTSSATIHPASSTDELSTSTPHGVVCGMPLARRDPRRITPMPATEKQLELVDHALTSDERLELVHKTLHVLFVTEFVVLVEYAEVMIPIIYNACVFGMIRLPNRAYYKLLATTTDEQLDRTLNSVAFYGALEFVSFVVLCALLRRKLRFSVLLQVAFVLENQFEMVQAKLVMWLFYVIQTSLQHFGADFSFSFTWLRANQ